MLAGGFTALNLLKDRGVPLEEQGFTWRKLMQPPLFLASCRTGRICLDTIVQRCRDKAVAKKSFRKLPKGLT
jgi:hypothetical protein